MVGPHAEQALSNLNADRMFLGVDGIDPEVGLTTPDVLEAQLSALMIRVSREVIAVADSSKFMQRSLSAIGKLDAMHKLITDDGIPQEMLDALDAAGVESSLRSNYNVFASYIWLQFYICSNIQRFGPDHTFRG